MDEQVDGLSTVEMCDKPTESGQDGVWETTQLDSAIGDLQRGLIDCSSSCVCPENTRNFRTDFLLYRLSREITPFLTYLL